jgi:hypothetical protein
VTLNRHSGTFLEELSKNHEKTLELAGSRSNFELQTFGYEGVVLSLAVTYALCEPNMDSNIWNIIYGYKFLYLYKTKPYTKPKTNVTEFSEFREPMQGAQFNRHARCNVWLRCLEECERWIHGTGRLESYRSNAKKSGEIFPSVNYSIKIFQINFPGNKPKFP